MCHLSAKMRTGYTVMSEQQVDHVFTKSCITCTVYNREMVVSETAQFRGTGLSLVARLQLTRRSDCPKRAKHDQTVPIDPKSSARYRAVNFLRATLPATLAIQPQQLSKRTHSTIPTCEI